MVLDFVFLTALAGNAIAPSLAIDQGGPALPSLPTLFLDLVQGVVVQLIKGAELQYKLQGIKGGVAKLQGQF